MSNIKNFVEIHINGYQTINVDYDTIPMSVTVDSMKNPPENKEIIDTISWDTSCSIDPDYKGNIFFKDGGTWIGFNEEKYADWVQPYVDIWQAEKDRLEQEQQAAREEYAKFENRKERALTQITDDYHSVLERGFVRTSLGFDADISPESVATLSGTQINLTCMARTLSEEAEVPKTVFRDFYGLKRELDAVQVERLVCEINGAQNHIRELKYTFKTQVKETYDNDGLNAVIEKCIYSTLDFTNGKPVELPFVQTQSIKDRIDHW